MGVDIENPEGEVKCSECNLLLGRVREASIAVENPIKVTPIKTIDTGVIYAKAKFIRDGSLIVISGWDAIIRIWEVHSGKQVAGLETRSRGPLGLAVSPDRQFVAWGDEDLSVQVWHLPKTEMIGRFAKGNPTWGGALAFSPDNKLLACGNNEDGTVIWDLLTGQEWAQLRSDLRYSEHLAFSPDGSIDFWEL